MRHWQTISLTVFLLIAVAVIGCSPAVRAKQSQSERSQPGQSAEKQTTENAPATQHREFSSPAFEHSSESTQFPAPRLSQQEEDALVTPKNPQAAAEHNRQVTMRSYPWSGPALVSPFKFPKSMYDHIHKHDPDISQRLQPSDFTPAQSRLILVGRGASYAPGQFNFLQYADALKHR